jgi:hypothetical protein
MMQIDEQIGSYVTLREVKDIYMRRIRGEEKELVRDF